MRSEYGYVRWLGLADVDWELLLSYAARACGPCGDPWGCLAAPAQPCRTQMEDIERQKQREREMEEAYWRQEEVGGAEWKGARG